jgi:hypothetical protein
MAESEQSFSAIMIPSTTTSVSMPPPMPSDSNRAKNISSANGMQFERELVKRGIMLERYQIPPDDGLDSLRSLLADKAKNPTSSVGSTVIHAMAIHDRAQNESTFYLVLPFLFTEWLVGMTKLSFLLNAQWQITPLAVQQGQRDSGRSLAMPKPDLTIGYNTSNIHYSRGIWELSPDSLPVACDVNLAFPFVTLEAKLELGMKQMQNAHNAAVMLRNLRMLSEKAGNNPCHDFDKKVRVLTIGVGTHVVQVFCHWTTFIEDIGVLQYCSSMLHSWYLTSESQWHETRAGLEKCVNWIAEENWSWMIRDLQTFYQSPVTDQTSSSSSKRPGSDIVRSDDPESLPSKRAREV